MKEASHLPKGALANSAMKVEVVEVYFAVEVDRFRQTAAHLAFEGEGEKRGMKFEGGNYRGTANVN